MLLPILLFTSSLLWISHVILTERYLEQLAERAVIRSALQSATIAQAVNNTSTAAALIARDGTISAALRADVRTPAALSEHLDLIRAETGHQALLVINISGDWQAQSGDFEVSLDKIRRIIKTEETSTGTIAYQEAPGDGLLFAHPVKDPAQRHLGTLIASFDILKVLGNWSEQNDVVLISDAEGTVLLSSRASLKNADITDLLRNSLYKPSLAEGYLRPLLGLGEAQNISLLSLDNVDFLALQRPVGFEDWQMTYLADTGSVEDRVNAVLALEITILACLSAIVFFVTARRAAQESLRMRNESAKLRSLNTQLTREIEERARVEQSLEQAERSLEQSTKLAALGQMSAAIAHELNQPLAAMKTYIAGAQLLLQRNRTEEAASSFSRIDDLITRMNALTAQLKSFARKGGEELQGVDLRIVLQESCAIMAPQIGQKGVEVIRNCPDEPVIVLGDALRLEQIFINLMRNSLDALQGHPAPRITLELTVGETLARAQVRDNGPGIEGDTRSLFEPFFTTKPAGDGVGLGLAISAQIARDMNGTLSARNSVEGGAVFELSLPLAGDQS